MLLVLVATNPTRPEYIQWMKESALRVAEGHMAPRVLIATLASPVIEVMTTDRNYRIFTIYRTGEIVVLGILRSFIPISVPE